MKCANPLCQHQLHYLRGGTLRLLELEKAADNPLLGAGGGFPVSPRTARYFWLCPECSQFLILRRWTQRGLVLQSRRHPVGASAATWTVSPEPPVDLEVMRSLPATAEKTA